MAGKMSAMYGLRDASSDPIESTQARSFQIHQFILFDVTDAEQAKVGESLASQLCCSYNNFDGFNAEQAGASINGAQDMTSREWRDVIEKSTRKGFFGNIIRNLETFVTKKERIRSDLEEELDTYEKEKDLEAAVHERDEHATNLKLLTDQYNAHLPQIEAVVSAINSKFQEIKERDRDIDDALDTSFLELIEGLRETLTPTRSV